MTPEDASPRTERPARDPAAETRTPIGRALFCAVDVETSGLNMSSRVVEVGAVRFDLAGPIGELQTLVNPCERIWSAATDIHGITDEMVSLAPRMSDVLPGLLNFMDGCAVLAHNARFDVHILSAELKRARMDPPLNPVVCTVNLARRILPGPPNYRLGTLVEPLGIDPGGLHSALPDARAAMAVFLACLDNADPASPLGELPGFLGPFGDISSPAVDEYGDEVCRDDLPGLARSRLSIEMEYGPPASVGTAVVTPLYLYERNGNDYLRAYCHRDGIEKTYRVDRIGSLWRSP